MYPHTFEATRSHSMCWVGGALAVTGHRHALGERCSAAQFSYPGLLRGLSSAFNAVQGGGDYVFVGARSRFAPCQVIRAIM